MLPHLEAEVFQTPNGTYYLKEPGVSMISRPDVSVDNLDDFLTGFDEELGFEDYTYDSPIQSGEHMGRGSQLCKVAGQLCYMSFGPKRTMNKDADKYFANIIRSGHGSVLEHANFSFLIYGVSRSLTHELVRHRAGMAFSQLSQRYIDGGKLRFVERPEFQDNPVLHAEFEQRIDNAADNYRKIGWVLRDNGTKKTMTTDEKKAVNQVARAVLPNETEAPIVVTGNVRAWRHILEMRGSAHAETEIRALAVKLYNCLVEEESLLFQDFESYGAELERHEI